ncbi:putative nuclease Mre11 [Phlyctochytrium arcticum]|nr:putative nuclease Mre11 [Phlyctochytrium arcticum]
MATQMNMTREVEFQDLGNSAFPVPKTSEMVDRRQRNSEQEAEENGSQDGLDEGRKSAGSDEDDESLDPDADTFKILIATDNHIGYMEKDPIRGTDSYDAFEEILKQAQANEVDMLLLGGDLFHDNKPSRRCMHTTMTLLRQYCLGERPCKLAFLSDQKENFNDRFGTVNYQDPNYNIGIPVFSIHGNHDDPTGDGGLCALDLLSVAGLVNYFGKQVEVDDINIKPILLQKGSSKLALYGLGNIRDERLHRTFQRKKVRMYRPAENTDDWFNLMVIHQNRVAHGHTNYIPENFLDEFLNLILWGHEHDCMIDPQLNSAREFWVTQPGSSVATSLSEGESIPKHIGLLKIRGSDFKLEKIRLKKVRPFVLDEVSLKTVEGLRPTDQKAVNAYLQDKVAELIDTAIEEWMEENPDQQEIDCPKPLIRLKVEYSGGFTTFNPQRFGQMFVERVANPKDILQFYRRRSATVAKERTKADLINIEAFVPEKLEDFRVEDLVTEYLNAQNLDLLPENELGNAVRMFVEKDDRDAIKEFVSQSLERTRQNLTTDGDQAPEDDDLIREEVEREKKRRVEEFAQERGTVKPSELMSSGSKRRAQAKSNDMDIDEAIDDDDEPEPAPVAKRGRGRGRAKAATTSTRGRGRGRGKASASASAASSTPTSRSASLRDVEMEENDDIIEDFDDETESRAPTPPPQTPATTRKRKLPPAMTGGAATPAPKRAARSTTTRATKAAASRAKPATQTTLNFSGAAASQHGAPIQSHALNLDDDDDDETFAKFQSSVRDKGKRRI